MHNTQSELQTQHNSYQIQIIFPTELKKRNTTCCMEPESIPHIQSHFVDKNKARCITLPDFDMYHTAIVIEREDLQKIIFMGHWNRTEIQEVNPHIYR